MPWGSGHVWFWGYPAVSGQSLPTSGNAVIFLHNCFCVFAVQAECSFPPRATFTDYFSESTRFPRCGWLFVFVNVICQCFCLFFCHFPGNSIARIIFLSDFIARNFWVRNFDLDCVSSDTCLEMKFKGVDEDGLSVASSLLPTRPPFLSFGVPTRVLGLGGWVVLRLSSSCADRLHQERLLASIHFLPLLVSLSLYLRLSVLPGSAPPCFPVPKKAVHVWDQ